MSISPSAGTCQPNGGAEGNESSPPNNTPLGPILEKLEIIDSKITALNDRHASCKQLSSQLQRMEANFRLLFHASRSEIAKLKCQLANDPSNSTINRRCNLAKVDPLRPISDSEIISLLHCPSAITFVQPEILIPYSKRVSTSTSSQSSSTVSSSSSNSSSLSSSSSNSSPLSIDTSPLQSPEQNPRFRKKLLQNKSDDQTIPIPVDTPVKQRLPKNHGNFEIKDASTEPANGTEGHLNRLFCASVRSARDHHAYSVMNAPPSRGHIPDDKEKADVEKYYDDMESATVKSHPIYPEFYDKGDQRRQDKMDVGEATEEQPRIVHRSDSPHIEVEEHVSDIDSPKSYADVTQEGGISEGEIRDDLDENTMTGDNDRNRESLDKVQRRTTTPHNYHQGDRLPRNPHHESSGRRSHYATPVRGRRTLHSSSSSERRRFSTRSSTDYSRRTPAKRPRYSEDDGSYKSSSTPKRRIPPPSSRNPSPRKTSSRSGGHSANPRGFQRQRTSSSLTYTTSSSSDRQRRRNRSYRQRQH